VPQRTLHLASWVAEQHRIHPTKLREPMTVLTTSRAENISGQVPVLMRVDGLSKRYGDQQALANVSFDVHGNEIVGLIGPNGAGKTTLLEAIAGLLPIDSGAVFWRDNALAFDRRRDSIFFLPDGVRPWQEQHVLQVIEFFAAIYGRSGPTLANTIRLLGLSSVLRKRVDALSKGFCRRLMLALALLTPHPLLLMGRALRRVRPEADTRDHERAARGCGGWAHICLGHPSAERRGAGLRPFRLARGRARPRDRNP